MRLVKKKGTLHLARVLFLASAMAALKTVSSLSLGITKSCLNLVYLSIRDPSPGGSSFSILTKISCNAKKQMDQPKRSLGP